jgi:hypothetical protein
LDRITPLKLGLRLRRLRWFHSSGSTRSDKIVQVAIARDDTEGTVALHAAWLTLVLPAITAAG